MYATGRYGVEYTPKPEEPSSGLGWLVLVIALLAGTSFVWVKIKSSREPTETADRASEEVQTPPPVSPVLSDATSSADSRLNDRPATNAIVRVQPVVADARNRPQPARILLMRLEEAEKKRDLEMQVSTIEKLRALPGSPLIDQDDKLARRLGRLNWRRLFELRNPAWVSELVVKRGDSATRLAVEHGSTLASFMKLNGGDADKLKIGRKVFVLNQPRFTLLIHRRNRTADLMIKDRFFKRYDLIRVGEGTDGTYETPASIRPFWRTIGAEFAPETRAELEMLLPKGTRVNVSEM